MRRFIVVILICVLALPTGGLFAQGQRPLATVRALAVNVRSGPGAQYPAIGQLKQGARFWVTAVTPDFGWLFFSYWGKDAYVTAQPGLVTVDVDLAQLPGATVADSVPPASTGAAIALSDYVVSPVVPAPGEPFEISLTLKNTGSTDAGLFSVAASFSPSNTFAWATVGKLGAGESGTVVLRDTGEQATGRFTIQVALDVENRLGDVVKDSLPEVTYRIDRPYIAQSSIKLEPFTNVDLHGGTPDLALDLAGLSALNGAQLVLLTDLALPDVHYDLLAQVKGAAVAADKLLPGALIGLKTAEGRRGLLRVAAYDGRVLEVQYFIYAK
jgi:hypothetical protein